MASNNKSKSNAQKLKDLGILRSGTAQRRTDDIENYLKEKVEKDEAIILDLIQIFKSKNPDVVVSFTFNSPYC